MPPPLGLFISLPSWEHDCLASCDHAMVLYHRNLTRRATSAKRCHNPGQSNPNALQDDLLSPSSRKHKRDDLFKSNLPQRVFFNDLPNTIYVIGMWNFSTSETQMVVEMFSVLSLNFVILRDRPEGADG